MPSDSDAVVTVLEAHIHAWRARMWQTSLAVALLNALLLLAIIVVMQRKVVDPVLESVAAIEALRRGEFGDGVPIRSDDELATLGRAVNAMALDLARVTAERDARERELADKANHDPLTGLLNRRALTFEIDRQLALAERHGLECALLAIDLDGFKPINDGFGHAAGDAVLRAIAVALRANLRCTDAVGRVGGDEFAALLPLTSTAAAMIVAAKVVDAIRGATVDVGGAIASVTASVGIAVFPVAATTRDTLLEQADAAMYRAKRAGGDRFDVGEVGESGGVGERHGTFDGGLERTSDDR